MSSHAFTGPGSDITPFQTAIFDVGIFFDTAFRRANGRHPLEHEGDPCALTWLVHVECRGDRELARARFAEILGNEPGRCTSVYECLVYFVWWRQIGKPWQMPKLPIERREAIVRDMQENAAAAVAAESAVQQARRSGA